MLHLHPQVHRHRVILYQVGTPWQQQPLSFCHTTANILVEQPTGHRFHSLFIPHVTSFVPPPWFPNTNLVSKHKDDIQTDGCRRESIHRERETAANANDAAPSPRAVRDRQEPPTPPRPEPSHRVRTHAARPFRSTGYTHKGSRRIGWRATNAHNPSSGQERRLTPNRTTARNATISKCVRDDFSAVINQNQL